jgi:dienelactone hydrolase
MYARKSWWLLNFVCAAAWGSAACATDATNATGDWGGLLPDPLRVIVHIRKSEGKYAATVEIPDETDEIFHPTIAVSPRRLRMTIKSLPIQDDGKSAPVRYDGHWDDAQAAWIGTWSLGTTTEPLVLKRVDKAAIDAMAPRRPQEAAIAAAPAPYTQEEVHFESSADHVILAGSFTRPAGSGPFPAVLLITGAGIQNRDALVYQHKTHLLLADDLTRRGIATLRYDKRGLFASGGDFKRATLADLVADASSALRYLESRREVDVHHVGLIGHSQGGWIAPQVAVGDSAVAFVVLMAAPAAAGAQGVQESRAIKDEYENVPPPIRRMHQQLIAAAFDPDAAQAKLRVRTVMAQAVAHKLISAAEANAITTRITSPEARASMQYDGGAVLRRLTVPVLALNGSLDHQVIAKPNLAALREAFSGNRDATVLELPGLNHMFTTARTGSEWEYVMIEESFAPAALKIIGDWVVDHTR